MLTMLLLFPQQIVLKEACHLVGARLVEKDLYGGLGFLSFVSAKYQWQIDICEPNAEPVTYSCSSVLLFVEMRIVTPNAGVGSYNRPEESRENAFFDDFVSNTDKTWIFLLGNIINGFLNKLRP